MPNKKISDLTSATLPLAGTEVLPIVQSSATVKVASNDLTVKNIRSNATTGILQIVGPAASSTRVMTTPDANFTTARTDAAQSFTGDQTLSTGNLIIGTSGKGIDFSVTPGTGTSELFNDYEEGTFTPTLLQGFSVAPTSYTTQLGRYTKIGRMVYFEIDIDPNGATGNATQVRFGGLPFTALNAPFGGAFLSYQASFNTNAGDMYIVGNSTTEIQVHTNAGAARNGNSAGVDINARVIFTGAYSAV